jgi:vacuolar-type H+-ATPase subunit I/STV1
MSDPVDAQNTFQKTIDDILKHLKNSKKDLIKIIDECYTELKDKGYPITTSPEKKVEEIINKFENLQNTNDYEIKRNIEVFSTFELPYDLEEEERIEEVYQSLIDSCNHYCRGEKQTKSKKDKLCECILEANKNKNISILDGVC